MRRFSPRTSKSLKGASVALGAIALAWVSTGVTLTLTVSKTNPELALAWWPWGAQPKAAIANRLVARDDVSPGELARAEQLAREALAREPVNVDAVRALAMVRARASDDAAADRLFAYSEKLSRRDLPTQIWMIEKAVGNDDIVRALTHYDRAMRTSPHAPELLLPTLIGAADEPAITGPLARLLAPRPSWWPLFLSSATKDIGNARALLVFARALKIGLDDPHERILAHAIVDRLVADRDYAAAYGFYAQLAGIPASSIDGVRDGEFDREPGQFIFDWRLTDEPDLSATREVFDGNDRRLVLRASGGRGGEVASQMLLLKPGTYRFSGTAGATGANSLERPIVIIRCDEKTVLGQVALPQADAQGASFAMTFTVPAGCASQTLVLQMMASETLEPWVDRFTIKPAA